MSEVFESKRGSSVVLEHLSNGAEVYAFFRPLLRFSGFSIQVDGDRFKLSCNHWYHNSFSPIFSGRVESHGSGSRIVGQFRMHLFVIPFIVLFEVLVLFGTLGQDVRAWPTNVSSPGVWSELLSQTAFLVVLLVLGIWIGNGDKEAMRVSLTAACEGKTLETPDKRPKLTKGGWWANLERQYKVGIGLILFAWGGASVARWSFIVSEPYELVEAQAIGFSSINDAVGGSMELSHPFDPGGQHSQNMGPGTAFKDFANLRIRVDGRKTGGELSVYLVHQIDGWKYKTATFTADNGKRIDVIKDVPASFRDDPTKPW